MTDATTYRPAAEIAPSAVRAEEPTVARAVGGVGLFFLLVGGITVVGNQYSPRILGSGAGYFLAALGLTGLLYHAFRDGDREFRRGYGAFALVLLAAGLIAAFVPGPLFGEGVPKNMGYHFLPWTPLLGMIGLAFFVAPLRHETDDKVRGPALAILLMFGAVLALGSVAFGIYTPDTLVGPGVLLAFLGLGFLVAFLSQVDCNDGPGRAVAVALGVVGAVALVYALGRAALPTALYDGPAALKTAYQSFDNWKLIARGLTVLVCLVPVLVAIRGRAMPSWVRGLLALVGLGFAGAFAYAAFASPVTIKPANYLVPAGLLLGGIGLIYLLAALGVVSDHALVTLTRRELAAYFYSPIAYIVLLGMAFVMAIGYAQFLDTLANVPSLREPIVQYHDGLTLIAAFAVVFIVPALSMRAFSEEKRSGTLEVLLTAPVTEWTVVVSKFLACWFVYMLAFAPGGLYLIALRVEAGQPFDYRPLLSYYFSVGVCGIAFISIGLFFSALTKNQVVAAVMTFAAMLFLLLTIWLKRSGTVGGGIQAVLGKLDFYSLWMQSLGGQVPVAQMLVFVSVGIFWLFLTVKTLEARKWG